MHIRVVAPSLPSSIIAPDVTQSACDLLHQSGFEVSFSKNYSINDNNLSTPVHARVEDLHEAYGDKKVDIVLAATGGSDCHKLLPHLDYALIKRNPKPLVGYSDTNALQNAIYTKTGVSSICGPSLSKLGKLSKVSPGFRHLIQALNSGQKVTVNPFSGVVWPSLRMEAISGNALGGSATTLQLLFGTEYLPDLDNSIIFLEMTTLNGHETLFRFERILVSLSQQRSASKIKAIVLGKFAVDSQVTADKIVGLFGNEDLFAKTPILYDADFGHLSDFFSYPIGKKVTINSHSIEFGGN